MLPWWLAHRISKLSSAMHPAAAAYKGIGLALSNNRHAFAAAGPTPLPFVGNTLEVYRHDLFLFKAWASEQQRQLCLASLPPRMHGA
jgi:hypothetical protein